MFQGPVVGSSERPIAWTLSRKAVGTTTSTLPVGSVKAAALVTRLSLGHGTVRILRGLLSDTVWFCTTSISPMKLGVTQTVNEVTFQVPVKPSRSSVPL